MPARGQSSVPARQLRDRKPAGGRVELAVPTGRDRAAYLRLREESAEWLARWEPLLPGGQSPIADETFDRLVASCDTPTSRRFLIKLSYDSPIAPKGTIVGQVSLNNISRGAFLSASAGYWIAQPFARRGFMREALLLAVTLAFAPERRMNDSQGTFGLGLHRVEANIMPRNAPSIGVVRSLGFRYEGTAQRYLQIAGVWEDHERWAVTAEEWPPSSESRGSRTPLAGNAPSRSGTKAASVTATKKTTSKK